MRTNVFNVILPLAQGLFLILSLYKPAHLINSTYWGESVHARQILGLRNLWIDPYIDAAGSPTQLHQSEEV